MSVFLYPRYYISSVCVCVCVCVRATLLISLIQLERNFPVISPYLCINLFIYLSLNLHLSIHLCIDLCACIILSACTRISYHRHSILQCIHILLTSLPFICIVYFLHDRFHSPISTLFQATIGSDSATPPGRYQETGRQGTCKEYMYELKHVRKWCATCVPPLINEENSILVINFSAISINFHLK